MVVKQMSEKRFKLKETLEDVLIEDLITQSKYSIYGIVDLLNELNDENEELNEQLNNYHATFQSLLKTNIKLNNQLAETQEQLRGLYKILFPEPDEAEHINCRCSYEPIE